MTSKNRVKSSGDPITVFGGRHNFLSNFHKSPIVVEGETYLTVEHAYQAFKSADPHTREWVRDAESPAKAKQRGAEVTLREGWEDPDDDTRGLKYTYMLAFIRAKFTQNPDLGEKLLATGERRLFEFNWWGDRYWGVYKGAGDNRLGEILEKVREELKEEKDARTRRK